MHTLDRIVKRLISNENQLVSIVLYYVHTSIKHIWIFGGHGERQIQVQS
jgi:hypothetical protein